MGSENYKARLVRNARKGVDPKVDEILDNPEGPLAVLHSKVLASWENKLRKSYIESARMASADFAAISRVIEVPLPFLEHFYEFFFDISDWDRLDKIEHIEKVGEKNKDEAVLKLWTLTQGLDFLSWRLGKKVTISPIDGLVDLFSTCIYRSKEAMFNGSGTQAGDQSIKWTKQSTDIGRLLKLWVMDSASAKKDLEIAIREVVPDFEGIDAILDQNLKVEAAALTSEQSQTEQTQTPLTKSVDTTFESIDDLTQGQQ